ncbi:F-box/LRR-repeat protein At3g48880 [Prunus persica]|nr:F-box/LRR-repeat protein At3g48880 [Prunus persica]
MNGFVKLVVSRSCGNATSVSLPECSDQILKYVANACPGLKALSLPSNSVLLKSNIIMELTEKLKHLESLSLGNSRNIAEILSQISLHCKNFRRLELRDCLIGDEEASSIIKLVLHIQYLVLRCSRIRRGNFITLLQVCKELVYLDASDCRDFEEDYDDILKLASHIAYFSCEGSQLYDSEDNHGRLISDGESSDDD